MSSSSSSTRTERRISAALLVVTHLCVIAALLWLYLTIERSVFPRATSMPLWVRIGYPLATCTGVIHFGRRAWQAYKRFRQA